MDEKHPYFRKVNFNKKVWNEADWERFFEAQDLFSRDGGPSGSASSRSALSFQAVMKRFGMDPSNPRAAPEEFDLSADPDNGGAAPAHQAFWKDGAEAEGLPIYGQAKAFAWRVVVLWERHFHRMLRRPYRSPGHRRLQALLKDIRSHAVQAPGHVAAGHDLGYESDGVWGNIVRCKKALSHADACLGLLSRFPSRRLPAGEFQRLFREALHLRNGLFGWIVFLRKRFVR